MKRFDDLYWNYKGIIETMEEMPGMYGLDQRRTDLHKQMEALYPDKRDELKEVLHNLQIDMQPSDVLWAINNIEKFRQDAKREGRHYAL